MMILKSDNEIDDMTASCQLAARVLVMIEPHIKAGISTLELNDICHQFIIDNHALPAPLNYRGFPKSVCTSVNDVVCHGIPSASEILRDGDIINIDVTTILNGYHGDTSRTFAVGKVSRAANNLINHTELAMITGINEVAVGKHVGDIGYAIEKLASKLGYGVVREYVGHGIGKVFHEDPQINHFGKPGSGIKLIPGMVFTVEPMLNEGHWKTKLMSDGWTARTIDGKLSAQFEHTIAIRSDGTAEILTKL